MDKSKVFKSKATNRFLRWQYKFLIILMVSLEYNWDNKLRFEAILTFLAAKRLYTIWHNSLTNSPVRCVGQPGMFEMTAMFNVTHLMS